MKKFMTALFLVLVFTLSIAALAEQQYYALNRVNLRAKPTVDSKILGVIDDGEFVIGYTTTEDETGKPWIYCDTQYGKGYVSYWSLAPEGKARQDDYHSSHRHHKDATTRKATDKANTTYETIKVSSHISVSSVKLVAKCDTVAKQDGKKATIKAGTKVTATRFYPDGTCTVKAPNGRDCKCKSKDFQTTSGKSIPKLRVTVSVDGKTLSKGKKLTVKYYVFSGNELYAYTGNGYILTSYLR